jgi:hypothetical protein
MDLHCCAISLIEFFKAIDGLAVSPHWPVLPGLQ